MIKKSTMPAQPKKAKSVVNRKRKLRLPPPTLAEIHSALGMILDHLDNEGGSQFMATPPVAAAAAASGGGTTPSAEGLPPAPRQILSESDTKQRVKVIIGGRCGENPSTIKDESPVRRPNLLLLGLRGAINRHFFLPDLHGIIGFPAGETVVMLSRRIKLTRDPQL